MRANGSSDIISHQTRAEMVQPDPVDHHAGGERIVFARDGIRHFQSAAAARKRLSIRAAQNLQKPAWHLLAFVRRIAANEDTWVALGLAVLQNNGVRR